MTTSVQQESLPVTKEVLPTPGWWATRVAGDHVPTGCGPGCRRSCGPGPRLRRSRSGRVPKGEALQTNGVLPVLGESQDRTEPVRLPIHCGLCSWLSTKYLAITPVVPEPKRSHRDAE